MNPEHMNPKRMSPYGCAFLFQLYNQPNNPTTQQPNNPTQPNQPFSRMSQIFAGKRNYEESPALCL